MAYNVHSVDDNLRVALTIGRRVRSKRKLLRQAPVSLDKPPSVDIGHECQLRRRAKHRVDNRLQRTLQWTI